MGKGRRGLDRNGTEKNKERRLDATAEDRSPATDGADAHAQERAGLFRILLRCLSTAAVRVGRLMDVEGPARR